MPVCDQFETGVLSAPWRSAVYGDGTVTLRENALHCTIPAAGGRDRRIPYHDAQITDYAGRSRRDYPWHPPLRLTVRAWASHSVTELAGTAGFGFWNEPFVPVGGGWPRLPRAVWFFFGAPPNNMALALGIPGWGWKAATLDAARLPFLLLAPFAPLGFLLMRVPILYRRLWPVGAWALNVSEALLPVDLIEPHTYTLEWWEDGVRWLVDGVPVHATMRSPRGPLGFIAWIDNQYAVVTPQGCFRFGRVVTAHAQSLVLDSVSIEPLT